MLRSLALALTLSTAVVADESGRLLRIDHYVPVQSAVPAMAGQTAQLYVREVVQPATVLRGGPAADRVVLFIHGAGTPAEVAFDVPYSDYSWMAYLANAGFDVFSMDVTGYGRSTRPAPMNDPCNLSQQQQTQFLTKTCPASYPGNMTTIASDWNDINGVVDYVRALRRVEKVSLVAWSLGGPRSGGYAAQHPEKVHRIVVLAPAYNRNAAAQAPNPLPARGTVFNIQSRAEFIANWERQVGCPGQYEKEALESVWSEMIASDPVGATWGGGVRRAPQTTNWGWGQSVVAKMQTPMLLVAGVHDKQVNPASVRNLYDDLGSRQKVYVDLACSSHNAMWERNHLLLFQASLEWLTSGTVNGKTEGIVEMGYEAK
jgi:pimeloyl-ACP methyl ester carboxylesterase